MVIIVGQPLLSPDAGELLEEEVVVLTIGWATVSYISCKPTLLSEE